MTEPKKQDGIMTTKDVVTTAASAGAAATSALVLSATSPPTTLALAAVLVTVLPPLLGAATEAGVRRMKARADRFLATIIDKWARDESKTQEEVAGLLEAAKEDPKVADAIWRAVRGLMEAPSDVATIPLGVLAAEYVRDGRAADAFFRSVVRLLTEASEQEVGEIAGVLLWVASATKRSEVVLTAKRMEPDGAGNWNAIPWTFEVSKDDLTRPDLPHQGSREDATAICDVHPEDGERLLFILKSSGIAYDKEGGGTFGGTPPRVVLRRTVVDRVVRLLGTREAPATTA